MEDARSRGFEEASIMCDAERFVYEDLKKIEELKRQLKDLQKQMR